MRFLVLSVLLTAATGLQTPIVTTRRAVLSSALGTVALPSKAFADTIEEIAARANAEAEEVCARALP